MDLYRAKAIFGGLAAGAVLATCLSALIGGQALDVRDARLVSDVDGSLRHICIHYRQDFNDSSIEVLSDFFGHLSKDVNVTVVVKDLDEFTFLKTQLAIYGVDLGSRMTALAMGVEITPWAKDRFGTMRVGSHPVIALPRARTMLTGARANDELVPEMLSMQLAGVESYVLPFHFEGGDLISDATTVYVAATLLDRNQLTSEYDRTKLLADIERVFKKKVILIGEKSSDVPDHHIGMYLTPLGNGTVAVGDPDMGLALYRDSESRDVVDLEMNDAAYTPFRNVIRILQERGLTVIHVPLLLTSTPRVYVTYNNAILESNADSRRIYMPVYGLDDMDRAAERVFQDQGWTVLPVRVGKVYRHTGSLRCLVGVISRDGEGRERRWAG
jgi:hypothetical protein